MPVQLKTVSITSDASGDGTGTINGAIGLIHNIYIKPITGTPGSATWTIVTATSGKDVLNGLGASASSSARLFTRADMGGTSNAEGALTVTGASMGNTKVWTIYIEVVS